MTLLAIGIAGASAAGSRSSARRCSTHRPRTRLESLVALQPDQLAPSAADTLGDLGLPSGSPSRNSGRPCAARDRSRSRASARRGNRARSQLEHGIDGIGQRDAVMAEPIQIQRNPQTHALPVAASTRRASTAIRCARYSALAVQVAVQPSAGPSAHRAPSARSASSGLPRMKRRGTHLRSRRR